MVPRLKKRAVSKPAKSHREPNVGHLAAVANADQSLSSKGGRARRARPVTMSRLTRTGQRTKSHINQATDSSSRRALSTEGNVAARSGTKRKSTSDQEDDFQGHLPKTRGRPRGAFKNDNDAVSGAPSDEEMGTKSVPQLDEIDEIPETQVKQPLIMDEPSQKREIAKGSWMGETLSRLNDKSTNQDTDEISLRRRLDDLGKRFENLQARHQDLWDIGVKAAESNFQNLKKQTEENALASNKLISHLQEELAAQSQVVDQVELLRKQLELSQAEVHDLRATLANTNDALAESKCEINVMSVKLAASRANEVHAKTASTLSKPTAPGNRGHQEISHNTRAKEDLYCDLTGLIVRDIKRGKKEDIYDCIQTGRNGSLHFKLALEKVEGNDFEDVQFTYRPQLDENRDSEVIEMLPDYLTEEITFPLPHASKFYTRVIKALTERLE